MTRTSHSSVGLAVLLTAALGSTTGDLAADEAPYAEGVFWPGANSGNTERIRPEAVFEHRERLYAAAFRWTAPPASRLQLELLVSQDRGARWRPVFTSPEDWELKAGISTSSVLTGGGKSLWIGAPTQGLFRSTDGGETWQEAAPAGNPISFAELPDGRVVVATRERGIWLRDPEDREWQYIGEIAGSGYRVTAGGREYIFAVSEYGDLFRYEGGTTWSSLDSPGTGSVRVVAARSDGELFLAPFSSGLYRSVDLGDTWQSLTEDVYDRLGRPVGWHAIQIDPKGPIWAGTSHSSSCCARAFRSDDGGASWQEQEEGHWPVFSSEETTLFRGPRGLIRQTEENGRESLGWRDLRLSCAADGALTAPGFVFATHNDFCARAGTETVLVPGNLDPNLIDELAMGPHGIVWAATYQGLYSARPGELWTRHERLGQVPVSAIATSDDTVLAGNRLGQVFRSERGCRWHKLSGVPGSGPIRFLVAQEAGTFTVVRSDTISRSADLETWSPLELPRGELRDLRAHRGELYARTADRALRFDEATSTWVDTEGSAFEAWVTIAFESFALSIPTYGRPTRIEPSSIANYHFAVLEPAGDGFYHGIPDQLTMWFKLWPPGPITPEHLEASCDGPASPIPGRAKAFECTPSLDGDSTANAWWVFGANDAPLSVFIDSRLEAGVLSRVRDSVRFRH